MLVSKTKKRKSRLGKKSPINDFISTNIIEIFIFFLVLIPFFNGLYFNKILKEAFIIPIFYFYFSEEKKNSFLIILTIGLLKDLLETNLLGLNISTLTIINFFIYYQHSINFDKKISYILTGIGSSIYILIKYILFSISNTQTDIKMAFLTIIINILIMPIIINIIEKTRVKIN